MVARLEVSPILVDNIFGIVKSGLLAYYIVLVISFPLLRVLKICIVGQERRTEALVGIGGPMPHAWNAACTGCGVK